jgi:ATP-dependent Zn protease
VEPKVKFNLWYAFLAVWGVFLLHNVFVHAFHVEHLPYSQFVKRLESGAVEDVWISQNTLTGSLKEGEKRKFVTVRVEPEVAELLSKYDVKFSGVIESTLVKDVLSWVLPVLVFFGVWYLLMRRMANNNGLGGTLLPLGKSKAKVYMEQETKVTFEDVAGIDEVEDELKEVVSFLKEPERYGRLGGRLPRGVLLVGPPGTGKTLIAKAVAGEAKVPFFSINGSEFVEMFVGVGAARVREYLNWRCERSEPRHRTCAIHGYPDGMGEVTALATYDDRSALFLSNKGETNFSRNYSENTAKAIDEEVKAILNRNYSAARTLIAENRSKLDAIATALLDQETLTFEEIQNLVQSTHKFQEVA